MKITKTSFAFKLTAEKLFECYPKIYFWTFTFKKVLSDWQYSYCWSGFIKDLGHLYGGALKGVRVVESHQSHGLHYHALLNQRIWAGEVRRLGARYGIGRVHVTRADQGTIEYMSKYLAKQFNGGEKLYAKMHRWGIVGGFTGTKNADVEIESVFHTRFELLKIACLLTGRKVNRAEISMAFNYIGTIDEWKIELSRIYGRQENVSAGHRYKNGDFEPPCETNPF